METRINAPLEVCFDLARSVETHLASTAETDERVVAGRTHGLFGLDDAVTWEAHHLGLTLRQGVIITRLDPPHLFIDESTHGPLRSMRHVHQFLKQGHGTLMVDTFEYRLPVGVMGRIADRLLIERYLRRFLTKRAKFLKQQAERSGRGG